MQAIKVNLWTHGFFGTMGILFIALLISGMVMADDNVAGDWKTDMLICFALITQNQT